MDRAELDDDGWDDVPDVPPFAEVYDLDQIELMNEVTHPIRGRVIRLLHRPRTVRELADLLEVPVTRLYHHLHRLEETGLVHVVATRQVGSATERRYRASAESYRISADALRRLDPHELSTAMGSLFDLARLDLQRGIEHGDLLELVEQERDAGGKGELILTLASLRLDDDRRREFVERLRALVEEFGADDGTRDVTAFVAAFPSS